MHPPSKRRKIALESIEKVSFDPAARHEYLTGFHKRKLQRTKQAQEVAEKKARAERIADRQRLREERKTDLARHLQEMSALMKTRDDSINEESHGSERSEDDNSEWAGMSDNSAEHRQGDYKAEYIDDDKNTTVTVEAMDVSKNGLYRAELALKHENNVPHPGELPVAGLVASQKAEQQDAKSPIKRPKKKRKNFRYESKAERKATRLKERIRNSKHAMARKST